MSKYAFIYPLVFISAVILCFVAPVAAQSQSFTTIGGTIGPGALYEIAMPTAAWNGELVVFTHGIVPPNDPISLPDTFGLREMLTSQGFALIYSSYSVNGFEAVKDGMQRTHQLRGIFVAKVAQPARVYLIGTSLGGLIAVMLAERFPDQYNGVLAAGSMLGGTRELIRYYIDGRILFDYFFPGVVPGTPWEIPPDIDIDKTFEDIAEALIQGFEPPYLTMQFKEAAKLPVEDPMEIVMAGIYAVAGAVEWSPFILKLTNGHMLYDNTTTWYTGSEDDEALNAGVARYASDPSAVNYIDHNYMPTGVLHIPVITLHSRRDPVVPFAHEALYAAAVAKAGASQFLLQRQNDVFDHTGNTLADYEAAFSALVEWVYTGVKPQN